MITLRKMTNINPFTAEYSCMRHRAPACKLGVQNTPAPSIFPVFTYYCYDS